MALMTPLLERLSRWPRPAVVAVGVLLLALVWSVDRLTGIETGLSVFYLAPISLVVWFVGRPASLPMALAASGAWLWADLHGGHYYSRPNMPHLIAGVHLVFFLVFSELLMRVQAAYRLQEEVSRLKSEMMSLVSHEFNNGLTTLKLATWLLQDAEAGDSRETRRKYYSMIDRMCQRLTMTIENFLKLNRLESGHLSLTLKPTAVRSLIEESIALLEPLAGEKNIRLRLDLPREVIPARADPDALALVISNLIGNAIKYTPAGGEVTVHLSREDEGKLRVCVEDTGIGIAAEDRQKILEGHFRTEEGSAVAKGHGIGLMVSRMVLECHGSALEVESSLGKGSRFIFRLPIWRG